VREDVMKRLAIFAGVAVVSALLTATVHAKDRPTKIYFVQNHSSHSVHPAVCLGSVIYEVLPAKRGDLVQWTIVNGNGSGNDDDICEDKSNGKYMDKTKVLLRFTKSPFVEKFGMPLDLAPQLKGGKYVIEATVDSRATMGAYKYVVLYDGNEAGPDPEVDVDCPTCG
jgi:hypothetical protein